MPPWVAKEKIGILLLASEMPVPILVPDTTSHELAAPMMGDEKPCEAEKVVTTARATPGHMLLTAHALTFGFLSATQKLMEGNSKGWTEVLLFSSTKVPLYFCVKNACSCFTVCTPCAVKCMHPLCAALAAL